MLDQSTYVNMAIIQDKSTDDYFIGWNDDWEPKPTWTDVIPNSRIVVFGSPKQAQRTSDNLKKLGYKTKIIELNKLKNDPIQPK